MSNTKAQFKAGWMNACNRYSWGESTKTIPSGFPGCAYFAGQLAACEMITHPSCDNAAMRAAEYGITGDEYTALHNLTLDV